MLYEYRRYDVIPGRLGDLREHFAKNIMPLWDKHEIEVYGIWEPVIGVTSDFHYMLRWKNMAEREDKFSAFLADSEWDRIRPNTPGGSPPVFRGHYQLWQPSPISPLADRG